MSSGESKAKHNRRAIHEFITIIRATLDRQTGGVVNLEQIKAEGNKPDSEPPLTDRAMRLVLHPDNKHAARHIDPAIDWLATVNGIAHYAVRCAIHEPTLPAKWENRVDEDDQARLYAYNNALRLIESRVREQAPDVELNIAYDPEDEPAANRTQSRDIGRRYDRDDAYRDLAKLVDKRTARGVSIEQAIEEVAYNNEVSIRKVKYARAFVREEAS